jgi:hypothetical protein
MAEYIALGKISTAALRNYLFEKKIDKGDTLVLNPMDYEHILDEIRHSGEAIDIPLNVLGVLLTKHDDVPVGKVQVVKNEKTIE